MSKLDKLRRESELIKRDIANLAGFRDTLFLRKFRRQLEGEKSVNLAKISYLTKTKQEKDKERKQNLKKANKNRSEKMKRNWRYLKAIKKNYPVDLSLRELRTALRKHRQGLETDVADVAWRNPSP